MKSQLHVLVEVKKIDDKMSRLKTELERIPKILGELQNSLEGKKLIYDAVKEKTTSSEKALRKAEADLKEKEDFLRKAESKMMEVKTNEEYKAAQKENEGHVSEKAKIEETIIGLMSLLDTQKVAFTEAEAEFKKNEEEFKAHKAELDRDLKKVEASFSEEQTKRNAMTSQLDPSVLTLYQKVSIKTKGDSIIVAENGMCLGCNMKIRSQLYNEILSLKVIHRCPNCGRILLAPSVEMDKEEGFSEKVIS